jgi:serine/alanine adding enzyme
MSLRIVTDAIEIDRKQWENFVLNHPQGTIFQTPQMFSVYASTINCQPIVLACYEEDSLVGILLAVLPLTDSEEITEKILSRYNKEISERAVFSQIRNFGVLNSARKKTFEMNGFTDEPHLNILVDLPADTDQFWKGIKRNRKDGINKAKRQGFVFEVASDPQYIDPFYNLLEESYKSIRLPYPDKSFFASLDSEAGEFTKWFVLKKDDIPVIVLAAFVYKGTIFAYAIGTTTDDAILNLRPVDIFYYEVMCWGIRNGFKVFDWMGAGKPNQEYGVRKFKIQYGGELIEMGRFLKIHKPLIMRMSKIGFWCWRKIKR